MSASAAASASSSEDARLPSLLRDLKSNLQLLRSSSKQLTAAEKRFSAKAREKHYNTV